MQKKILFMLLLTTGAICSFSQQTQKSKLTDITWVLKKDAMSGIGNHLSLSATTLLKFHRNGTWTASAPIAGNDSGSWHTNSNGKVIMEMGESKKAVVTALETCCLQIEQRNALSRSTWIWERK